MFFPFRQPHTKATAFLSWTFSIIFDGELCYNYGIIIIFLDKKRTKGRLERTLF